MEKWNTYTSTLSDQWLNTYSYIRAGDLVSVGPVQNKKLGIALDMQTVSFGMEPDEWNVLVDGKIKTYSLYYISVYSDNELLTNNYHYNYHLYKGVYSD